MPGTVRNQLMRSAAAFGIASSLLLVGCASDPVSRSVQPAPAQPTQAPSPPPPSAETELGLGFDEACAEYDRVTQLINQGTRRATEAVNNQNWELGASISRNHIELLTDLNSKQITDPNLSPAVAEFVSAYIEFENYFIKFAEIVDAYGAGSPAATAYADDPLNDIILENALFRVEQVDSICGF